jgi:hypothetical protein
MTKTVRRMAAAVAVASFALAAAMVQTSAVSSAQCDPNWSRNVITNECKPAPAPPVWWTPRPAYAPPYAPADVPPPPPPPPWAQQMEPRWDEGGQPWIWAGI